MSLDLGFLFFVAIFHAAMAAPLAIILSDSDHPITCRSAKSIMHVKYIQPSLVCT